MILIYFLTLILELGALLIIPTSFSLSLGMSFLAIFIIQAFFYLKLIISKIGILSFDLFFLFGLFNTSFIPLLFIDEFNLYRAFSKVNYYIINKSTLISLIGASAYMLVSLIVLKYVKSDRRILNSISLNKKLLKFSYFLSVLLFVLFLFRGGINYLYAYSNTIRFDLSSARAILDYFKIIFLILIIQIFIKNRRLLFLDIIKKNKALFLLLTFIIAVLLLGGTRNMPIQLMLIITGAYSFIVKKIGSKTVILFIFLGFFSLTFIRIVREQMIGKSTIIESSFSFNTFSSGKDFFLELSTASGPLYNLIDETDSKNPSYGKGMLFPAISIIPFSQSLVIAIFDLDRDEFLTTSYIATQNIYDSLDSGVGTHLIGDIYYNFGLIGVVFFMGLLGMVVSNLTLKISSIKSVNALTVYIGLLSISLFYARVEYMYPFHYIVWAFMITYIFSHINTSKAIRRV